MKSALMFRLLFLSIALAVVIWMIRLLSAENIQGAFEALGLQPGNGSLHAARPLAPGEERFNLCPTRIVEFAWEGAQPEARRAIAEQKDGMRVQWMAFDPAAKQIDTIAVEKWLSRHCQVALRQVPETDLPVGAETQRLSIRYFDGSQLAVDEIGGHYFKMNNSQYDSADFAEALKELRELASLAP